MNRQNRTGKTQQLRIIGGKWRGRKFSVANVPGLRPTGDRIRETVFNWLMSELPNSRCLDLFAGSGALGFECLSRGANQVTLLENNETAYRQLLENKKKLMMTDCEVLEEDTLRWLSDPSLGRGSIDIVFVDPPFAKNLWGQTCDLLMQSQLLAKTAKIYVETPKACKFVVPEGWELHREKYAGDISYRLYSLVNN